MEKLIAIVGPTASGKSSVAVELAKLCNGEIISADSAQVYKYLNIGTAKITDADAAGIHHHLIDIVDNKTEYNVGIFQDDARNAIKKVLSKGKMPILCGGSGLYINSVINSGYELGVIQSDPSQRQEYLEMEEKYGQGYLYGIFKKKFPNRAEKIHPNDYQRILRGLEFESDIPKKCESNLWKSPYNLKIFGLNREREHLYQDIDQRVDYMFNNGLIDEVKNALSMGYNPQGNALTALGYKEIMPLINDQCDEEQAKATLKLNTRHFAKRQLTWFRRDPRISWYDTEQYKNKKEISFDIFTRLKQDKFIV